MRLGQNGKRSDVSLEYWDTLAQGPSVERQHPPHSVIVVELGKPVDLRREGTVGKHAAKRVNRQRVWDRGESECRTVMARIGDNVLRPKGSRLPRGVEW
jgi:hypothetical protein